MQTGCVKEWVGCCCQQGGSGKVAACSICSVAERWITRGSLKAALSIGYRTVASWALYLEHVYAEGRSRCRGKWEVLFEVFHIRKREHLAWLCQRLALFSWANYFRPEFILFPPTDTPDCCLVFWDTPKGAKIAGFGMDIRRAFGSWAGVPKSRVSGQVWREGVCSVRSVPCCRARSNHHVPLQGSRLESRVCAAVPVCPGMGRAGWALRAADQCKARSAFWVLGAPQKKGSVIVTLHSCLLIVSSWLSQQIHLWTDH